MGMAEQEMNHPFAFATITLHQLPPQLSDARSGVDDEGIFAGLYFNAGCITAGGLAR